MHEINDKFENYYQLFEAELSKDYINSKFNLTVALAAKNEHDGTIVDEFCDKFISWNSFEWKCLRKHCNGKFQSPYGLLLHNNNFHPDRNEGLINCSLCSSTSKLYSFTDFYRHIIENHHRHLKYW